MQASRERLVLAADADRQRLGRDLHDGVLQHLVAPASRAALHAVTFTPAQWGRMQIAFPDGVCDSTRPGVGQQPAVSPLTSSGGPGGVPLPPAPEAVAAPEH